MEVTIVSVAEISEQDYSHASSRRLNVITGISVTICQLLCSDGGEFGIKVLPGMGSVSLVDFLISTNSKKKLYGTCT